MSCEVESVIEYDSNDEELVNDVAKGILGSEFRDYVGSFPLINTSIEIGVGTKFHSMEIAVHFIEQYALQNNFALFKHKSEKFADGDRKSTRLNSSHRCISYAVFCLKKKNKKKL